MSDTIARARAAALRTATGERMAGRRTTDKLAALVRRKQATTADLRRLLHLRAIQMAQQRAAARYVARSAPVAAALRFPKSIDALFSRATWMHGFSVETEDVDMDDEDDDVGDGMAGPHIDQAETFRVLVADVLEGKAAVASLVDAAQCAVAVLVEAQVPSTDAYVEPLLHHVRDTIRNDGGANGPRCSQLAAQLRDNQYWREWEFVEDSHTAAAAACVTSTMFQWAAQRAAMHILHSEQHLHRLACFAAFGVLNWMLLRAHEHGSQADSVPERVR